MAPCGGFPSFRDGSDNSTVPTVRAFVVTETNGVMQKSIAHK